MTTPRIIVVGAGFQGIYSAWQLARTGADVRLVNGSREIGGSMRSIPWNGYQVDNGTHNLDIRTEEAHNFFSDILGEELALIPDHSWASTLGHVYTPGFSWPDFSHEKPALAKQALTEMQHLFKRQLNNDIPSNDHNEQDHGYLAWFEKRFGRTLTHNMLSMMRKATDADPNEFSEQASDVLSMFVRVKLGDDSLMAQLKQTNSHWDRYLGVSIKCTNTDFLGLNRDPKFAYTTHGGLTTFCDKAEQRLRSMGVTILNEHHVESLSHHSDHVDVHCANTTLKADKVLWTLPDHLLEKAVGQEPSCLGHVCPSGFCIFAFEVPVESIEGPDFLIDFSDQTHTYRYGCPGRYGNQISNDGYTYVLAEQAVHPSRQHKRLSDAGQALAWHDLQTSGFINGTAEYRAAMSWSVPVGMSIPLRGWYQAHHHFEQAFMNQHPNIVTIEPRLRGRTAFVQHYKALVHSRLIATDADDRYRHKEAA